MRPIVSLPDEFMIIKFYQTKNFFQMMFNGQNYKIIGKDDVGNFVGLSLDKQVFYLNTTDKSKIYILYFHYGGAVLLKNKLRNITVAGQDFVYWYLSGKNFVLNISPKNDKTTKVKLVFAANAPDDDPIMFWAFYKIKGVKDNTENFVCLTSPKNIAEILSFLLDNKEKFFVKGQTYIINNAMDLLNEMGYTNLSPVWIREW